MIWSEDLDSIYEQVETTLLHIPREGFRLISEIM
jgi:hypothetical protein